MSGGSVAVFFVCVFFLFACSRSSSGRTAGDGSRACGSGCTRVVVDGRQKSRNEASSSSAAPDNGANDTSNNNNSNNDADDIKTEYDASDRLPYRSIKTKKKRTHPKLDIYSPKVIRERALKNGAVFLAEALLGDRPAFYATRACVYSCCGSFSVPFRLRCLSGSLPFLPLRLHPTKISPAV